jgi:hypothetical protein
VPRIALSAGGRSINSAINVPLSVDGIGVEISLVRSPRMGLSLAEFSGLSPV